jgi:hypothetical protein
LSCVFSTLSVCNAARRRSCFASCFRLTCDFGKTVRKHGESPSCEPPCYPAPEGNPHRSPEGGPVNGSCLAPDLSRGANSPAAPGLFLVPRRFPIGDDWLMSGSSTPGSPPELHLHGSPGPLERRFKLAIGQVDSPPIDLVVKVVSLGKRCL